MIPALSIIARSGTGKTTYLEQLIPLLKRRGYRIGVVKQTHHEVEMDRPGKDSYRLREAGADEVILNAPNQMALVRKQNPDIPLREILSYFRSVDLILIEGYRGGDLPKIEIFRTGAGHPEPLLIQEKSLIALVTDDPFPEASFSVFTLKNVEAVANLIEKEILKSRPPRSARP